MIFTRRHRSRLILLACVALCAFAGWALEVRAHARATPPALAAMLPQGALLTIESPDFAALLADWNNSPQARAWLASDNYRVFSNSNLFGRLSDAQNEFFSTAFQGKAPASPALLTQVAGKQSIFAWYSIGKLEFLYVTRMASAQALRSALLQQRGRFQQRQAAGQTFYVRASQDLKDSPARTVAFATVADPAGQGDLLLLATREDLLANALTLIAGRQSANSLASEPWYAEADAALAPEQSQRPMLHMTLNLERIVPMPYFSSYWVQQNITEMARYRAAVADLYREPAAFREERALLPKEASEVPPTPQVAALAALAPAEGVYRATATQDPAVAVVALEEKLLGRQRKVAQTAEIAPDATLDLAQAGSVSDLETRIDTPEPVSATYSNEALISALRATGFDALLTYSSAQLPAPGASLWVPIHSAVVLHAASAWDGQKLQSALQQSLRGALTTSVLGIGFRSTGNNIYALDGPKPLFLSVRGNLAYLADDQPLLLSLLQPPTTVETPAAASTIAGFNHSAQRAPYARLTSLIDSTNAMTNDATKTAPEGDSPKVPAFFSQNLRSLSDSFAALQSERFVESRDGAKTHQTVTYQWH